MLPSPASNAMIERRYCISARFVETVQRPGCYGDGRGSGGLSLWIKRTGRAGLYKFWASASAWTDAPANSDSACAPTSALPRPGRSVHSTSAHGGVASWSPAAGGLFPASRKARKRSSKCMRRDSPIGRRAITQSKEAPLEFVYQLPQYPPR